jgi:hypothetical protein
VKEIIQYSRTFAPQVQTTWNQANAPLFSILQHPGSVDLITTEQNKTKQNKLPSFIDRFLLIKLEVSD